MINRTHYKMFKLGICVGRFIWVILALAITTVCILMIELFSGLLIHPVITFIVYTIVGLIAGKLPEEAQICYDFGYVCGRLGVKDKIDYEDLKDYFGD